MGMSYEDLERSLVRTGAEVARLRAARQAKDEALSSAIHLVNVLRGGDKEGLAKAEEAFEAAMSALLEPWPDHPVRDEQNRRE